MLYAFLLAAPPKGPTLRLSPLFSDGAILQRGMPLPVFGQAAVGAKVSVALAGQTTSTSADATGHWIVLMRPLAGAGPFTLSATSGGETVGAKGLLAGEVWLAAGQSNMEFPEASASDYAQAQAEARSDVRLFNVEKATADAPLRDLKGRWEAASAVSVGRFPAVALAFAREVQQRLGVPVGIVQATWGGSPAEAWTPREALAGRSTLKPLLDAYDAAQKDYPKTMVEYRRAIADFVNFKHKAGNEGFMHDWQAPETRDDDWSTVPASTPFPAGFVGAAWYRKTVDVPPEWVGKGLTLSLGTVGDFDTTYFDGIRVGRTGAEDDNGDGSTFRRYRIAPGIVRPGRNVIAVRAFADAGIGGLTSPASEMSLSLADGSASVPLDGEWRFRVERALDPKTQIPARPIGLGNPNVPAALYDGMLAPVMSFAIRGAIWYQGEANVGRAAEYRDLLPTMVESWRANWGEGAFPFYEVQLANYLARRDVPGDSAWAELREAQATLALPNTGVALALDLGEADDIHYRNKREVGRRLALFALGRTYGEAVVYEGPLFDRLDVVRDEARVAFRNGSLLTTDGRSPRGFAIAGADGRWAWADARLDGSTVVLRSAAVPKPVAVRYAWADNPDVNLVNHAGLPAAPFRTDRPG